MTGTSIDALDVALVRIEGRGIGMRAELVRTHSRPLATLGPRLRALADQHPASAGEIAALARDFALFHASAIVELLQGDPPPNLIAVHGQTVFHAPPVSWQMFNGAVLAHELRAPVVFDLRAADLAAGGQGAPITPLADWILFRSERRTAVINLGGFCNATLLPACRSTDDPQTDTLDIEGFDVCACNQLLDRIARDFLGHSYDEGGREAASGRASLVETDILSRALGRQSLGKRSLGTGDECAKWVEGWAGKVEGKHLAATACLAIARTLAGRIGGVDRVLIAGGGARNLALVAMIAEATEKSVELTDAAGIPIEFREAAEMAVLGALCQDRVPITLPRVTGVSSPAPIAGIWAGL